MKFHEIKQDVLLKISDIIGSYGAEVAFPTRTLHVADALRIEREPDEGGESQGSGDGKTRDNDKRQDEDAADEGPVREPSGPGQKTTQGDEAEQ